MIARGLGAVQFLTTIPIRGRTASPGASAAFFPLVGALLGVLGALLFIALQELIPTPVAAAVVLGVWALLTGGLHEDGLADVADAFRAGRSPDRILAILKDSRIGAHGALALTLVVLLRWSALSSLQADPLVCLPAILAVSRGAMVGLAWISAPAGRGLGFAFSNQLNTRIVLLVLAQMVIAITLTAGPLLLWGAILIVLAARAYCQKRIGGITGDCLGATSLIVETWGLILYACQRCM